jgi:hypothetical protein
MKHFAILCCLSLAAFAQQSVPAQPPSALDQVLISNSKAVLEAQKAKDIESLKRLLNDSFQQVGSDGKLSDTDGRLNDKEQALNEAKDGNLKDYSVYSFKLLKVDDNAVIVTYDAIIHMPEGDNGLAPRYQRFSDLWVRQGDQWSLRFRQSTPARHID